MRYLQEFLAVALAEMRAARRLARTWIFVAVTVLIGFATYLQYAFMHGFGSGFSATIGAFGPRMLVTSIGMTMVVVLIVGIVFLAFDIRARDQRERMAEVLDARPIGNINLLAGRLAGLVFMLWLTVAVLMGLMQLVGVTAKASGWWIGDTVEPISVASFLVFDAVPALALWGSLVILLAVAVRNRLVTAIAALAIFGLYVWAGFEMPRYLGPAVGGFQAFQTLGSDLLPEFATAGLVVQRLATLGLAGAMLVLAAALHPRRDGRARGERLALAAVLAGLAGTGIGYLVMDAMNGHARQAEWTAVHAAAEAEPRADLVRVGGSVVIDPGERLGLKLVYGLTAPERLDELVFSFNPGLEVSELRLDGVSAASSHEAGLLRVALPTPLQPGDRVELQIAAAGVPDASFAYLDSDIDMALVAGQAGNLFLLGTDGSVFDTRYVALMPGVRWLPLPGPATGDGDLALYGRDYFTVDLEVEVPTGWLVAGPGRRREAGEGRFRFAPAAPVPEVALLASAFERRHMEVADVAFELLLHPGHGEHLSLFADAVDELEERIEEILARAQAAGLAYPYDGLSLVEVPARLRVFGGGWRMDSVQALPGIMMLREYGLPTARFDTLFALRERSGGGGGAGEDPGTEAGLAKVAVLEQFFASDFSGGKLVDGVTRSFLKFQTGAHGQGAIALDYVCHELAAGVIHHRQVGDYFSPRTFASSADLNQAITGLILGIVTGGGGSISIGNMTAPKRASVWSRALGTSLATLDPGDEGHEALNVLSLKAPAVAKSIIDGLGRDAAAAFLAELRRRFAGSNFTAADFRAVAADTGTDLDSLLGDWLGARELPGFLVSEAQVVRLTDGERGEPRYQVRAHVRNDEPTPGLVRFGTVPANEDAARIWGDPVRIGGDAAVEIGLVVGSPPAEVWVSPYLSLNRRDIHLEVPEFDDKSAVDAEPLNGSRESPWRPQADPGIVVDDLDPGFSIVYETMADKDRYEQQAPNWLAGNVDMDQGLPVYDAFVLPAKGWMRIELPGSWGRYRHTVASAFPGDGRASVRFVAQLPEAGRWRVDYHVPEMEFSKNSPTGGSVTIRIQTNVLARSKGNYEVKLLADGVDATVEFDADVATIGWNGLGEFRLPAGEVSLVLSNKTAGSIVVADAVRWRRVEER